jgi:hypothetical protein
MQTGTDNQWRKVNLDEYDLSSARLIDRLGAPTILSLMVAGGQGAVHGTVSAGKSEGP